MIVSDAFVRCVDAIAAGVLIKRESKTDKEFHFQNWFRDRLSETGAQFEIGGRNSYPDFRMITTSYGFEIKGLGYPGREASFDSNSQIPTGFHNGRTIYYVFGRYPKTSDGDTYPVLDLVVCHGDFLDINHDYLHKNKHIKGFGSYGDILIRDRKMYVVPTPFKLVEGLAHSCTLILPGEIRPGRKLKETGTLIRHEAEELVVGYSFDLRTNEITPKKIPNPRAGLQHRFRAWRLNRSKDDQIAMRLS